MLSSTRRILAGSFGEFVARCAAAGELVVQPRMGFGSIEKMRSGLIATKRAGMGTVATITLDSYTRTGDHAAARRALATGMELNGFPLLAHGAVATTDLLAGVCGPDFPVQVRHGSAAPQDIFATLIAAGITATEGGPVSYCLPYSRTPLAESVRNWAWSCELLAAVRDTGREPHLESFGGCLLGQLCPPGLLVAMSVLEGLFFRQHGLYSISLSYAQQTNATQDAEAIDALDRLAAEFLPDCDWHILVYAYMGLYPCSAAAAHALLTDAATLAVHSPASRLIVKTAAEAHRIPSIAENVTALQVARFAAARAASTGPDPGGPGDTGIYTEARTLIEAVLNLSSDLGTALVQAFRRGYLDVPYCLHPDNAGRSRSYLDPSGRLVWSDVGSMPITRCTAGRPAELTSGELLAALSYVERKYTAAVREPPAWPVAGSAGYARADRRTAE